MFKKFLNKLLINLNKFTFFKKIFNLIKLLENYKKIPINDKNIFLLDTNFVTNYRIRTFFSKEPETIDWINNFQNNSVFWDIGANVGLYSIYSQIINKNIQTLAFEPSVLNLDILVKNIYKNNLQDKISVITNPLYNQSTIKNFKLSTLEKGGANSNFGEIEFQRKSIMSYKTNSLDIENFFRIYDIESPDYIKLDVDGNEVNILKSLLEVKNKIKSILIEVNFKKEELEKILLENKFKKVFKSDNRNNEIWEKS